MSGNGYDAPCPVCGESMDVYEDHKPYPTRGCWCYHCGFVSNSVVGRMDLDEMNERREEDGDKKITKKQYEKYSKDYLFTDLK